MLKEFDQRGGIGGPARFVALRKIPPIPINLDQRYPDPDDPEKTVDYFELTGVTEEDLARLGLAPVEPAGEITLRAVYSQERVSLGGKLKFEKVRKEKLFVEMTGKESRRLSEVCEKAAKQIRHRRLRELGILNLAV